MLLFDTDLDWSNAEPADYSQSHFDYLNCSGRLEATRIRELLEQWFSWYPAHSQAALRARFRSPDDVPHHSAFFELYLHELLRILGYQVEVAPTDDPGPSEKRPDFVVHRSSEPQFWLEATLATDRSTVDAAAEARLNQAYDALNKLDSPNFFVGLDSYGNPYVPVPERKLLAVVGEFLRTLDPDLCARILQEGGLSALPRKRFEHEGWRLEIFPIPKSKEARGRSGIRPVGMVGPGEGDWVDDRRALRDAVTKKATRYGELGMPYIVAVNAVNQHLDEIDIMNALFGQETLEVSRTLDGPGLPCLRRQPDGAWWGHKGPINTRVSAVLVLSSLTPWNIRVYSPVVYHNPWAKYSCPQALTELHTARAVGHEMRVIQGQAAQEIFGLSNTWPK